ncbi:MAG: hypothetical protein JO235_02770 [Chroococcidiopsidaceae cyanobacterium CP_BM_RX_35]|nr:hypothetical protein [Chroococcidiopsidaceae cyanobacterium CP_BM_RX_35]
MQLKQVTIFAIARRLMLATTAVMGLLTLPFPKILLAQEAYGSGVKGDFTTRYGDPGAELLRSFFFRFESDDHPLQTIAAHPVGNSNIEISFADRDPTSNDDKYDYDVISQPLKNSAILLRSASQNLCFTYCYLDDPKLNDSNYVFVLRGFKFTYARDDFAIKKIMISKEGGAIDVELHDRSGRNQFAIVVDYALVPRELVASTNSITGVVRGSTRRSVSAGTAVLSGFALEYLDDDYRMREFGILARQPVNPGPNIEIYFSDNSQSRRFSYKVDYALLR